MVIAYFHVEEQSSEKAGGPGSPSSGAGMAWRQALSRLEIGYP